MTESCPPHRGETGLNRYFGEVDELMSDPQQWLHRLKTLSAGWANARIQPEPEPTEKNLWHQSSGPNVVLINPVAECLIVHLVSRSVAVTMALRLIYVQIQRGSDFVFLFVRSCQDAATKGYKNLIHLTSYSHASTHLCFAFPSPSICLRALSALLLTGL